MRLVRFAPLLLAACHATTPTSQAPASARPVITDGVVDIGGGVALHIHCVGDGAPTVVLDAGLGNDGSVWNDVLPEMGKFTRACAYDRAGMGYSSRPAPRPHTNRKMARELHALLERAGLVGPYVVVGHSLGGVNVRLFASEHLDEVAGMVLVDAVGDEQPARLWSILPASEMAEFREGLSKMPEGMDFGSYVASIAEMRAASRSIGDRPLVVLTHGKEEGPPGTSAEQAAQTLRVWQEMQAEMLKLSTNSVQVVAEKSGHYIQLAAPRLVVAAVREVVEAARARRRVSAGALEPLAHGDGT
jgi:pimeloyl-ACP methyl ester carboxylesterase